MRPRTKKCRRQGFWGRVLVRDAASIVIVLLSLADTKAQEPEPSVSESPPEAEIEPTPLPGTEILLEPQVNFEALARSGRLWSFHGVVTDFRFVGNHAFSTGDLAKQVEKYKNRELTAEDLEQARQDLTLLYINKGYVNSGAVLPEQDGKNGIITFELVEGRLTGINLKGNFWFRH